MLVVMAAFAVGCGSTGKSATTAVDTTAQERAREQREEERREAAEREQQQADYEACRKRLGPLQRKLETLGSRLAVGLNFERYGTAVADARVVYDRIDFEELSEVPDCVFEVGISLERALNQFARAHGTWAACFEDWDCDMDSIDPKLQEKWASAGRSLEKARDNLDAMEPEDE
jgi:hypothetical protein